MRSHERGAPARHLSYVVARLRSGAPRERHHLPLGDVFSSVPVCVIVNDGLPTETTAPSSDLPFTLQLTLTSPVPICSILNHVVQELPGPAAFPLTKNSGDSSPTPHSGGWAQD
jgi:hypothetical protein